MKTIQKITKLISVIAITLMAVGCEVYTDEFNPNNPALKAKAQELQNSKIVNLTVMVNDVYEGKFLYKIEIFDTNPTENSAVLLKSGVGSRDLFFTSNVSVPEFHKTIYIRQTDPFKNQLIKTADVSALTENLLIDFSK